MEDKEYIIKEFRNLINENLDGRKIEELAKKFGVPDSVMAVRLFDIKLEELINKFKVWKKDLKNVE